MKFKIFVLMLFILCNDCQRQIDEKVTLPEIDISAVPGSIVPLPDHVPQVFRDNFVKYTRFMAPNGKPIHFLAQEVWTDDQVRHARNVLKHILTNYPGSEYGDDKTAIANSMSDKKATMVLFNDVQALERAFSSGLATATDLSMQDLRSNESPAVGDLDYMNHITRDAAYEEIWHLVHDYGIKPTLPEMITEMKKANDVAAEKGWRGWPEDEPEEHPNEYVGVLIDNYYDLWKIHPTKYEGRPIEPGDIPEGHSHFGRYFANNRNKQKEEDPLGFAVIEKFFHPYLTYRPELPEDFQGTFSIRFDPESRYTSKAQHLVNVSLTGSNNANLSGNDYDNTLIGNSGGNILTGAGGNDQLDGNAGEDTAVFSGVVDEYVIVRENIISTVSDKRPNLDGIDTLKNIEFLQFRDQKVNLNHLSGK